MATRIVVTFEDGSSEEVRLTPRAFIEAERKFKGELPAVEGVLYAAWFKLGKPRGHFDTWVDTVDEMSHIEDDAPVPTQPEAGGGS